MSDTHRLVEKLNKLLVSAAALQLMEMRGLDPGEVVRAGDWGRAWQDCDEKFICDVHFKLR